MDDIRTQPSYTETTTLEIADLAKFHPTFIIIANKCVWTRPSYAQYAPIQEHTTPDDYSAFPLGIPDTRLRTIRDSPTFRDYVARYTKAAAEIEWWVQGEPACHEFPYQRTDYIKRQMATWHKTASDITHFPQFAPDWPLPAFYPWYKSDLEHAARNTTEGTHLKQYTEQQIQTFRHNIYTDIQEWQRSVETVYLPQGWPFPKCLWYHQFITDTQDDQLTDPSQWNTRTPAHNNFYIDPNRTTNPHDASDHRDPL